MFCGKCGQMLPDDSRFCSNCGSPVHHRSAPAGSGFEQGGAGYAPPGAPGFPERGPGMPPTGRTPSCGNMNMPAGNSQGMNMQNRNGQGMYGPNMPSSGWQAGDPRTAANANASAWPNASALPEHLARIGNAENNGGNFRKFYFIDFIVRMVGVKENIPLFIYLLMNVVFMGLVATGFTNGNFALGMLIGLIAYIISMMLALSPFGEWLLRNRVGCRPITDQAVAGRIMPLFNEVYANARRQNPNLPDDIGIFISDDPSPNAFATGRRTVCVTMGMLSRSDEQIKGALGHEFGHLSHKDTDRLLVISIGNTFVTAICVLAQIGAFIFEFFTQIMAAFMGRDGFFVALMASFSRFMTVVLIGLFMKVWTAIGVALCMKTSRGNEYQADEFSVRLGYGSGLISVLRSFGSGPKPEGLFAALASSHPDTGDRISRIQYLMGNAGRR